MDLMNVMNDDLGDVFLGQEGMQGDSSSDGE